MNEKKFYIYYIDVVIASFYSFLDKVIYVKQLYPFKIDINIFYILFKVLYSLR